MALLLRNPKRSVLLDSALTKGIKTLASLAEPPKPHVLLDSALTKGIKTQVPAGPRRIRSGPTGQRPD